MTDTPPQPSPESQDVNSRFASTPLLFDTFMSKQDAMARRKGRIEQIREASARDISDLEDANVRDQGDCQLLAGRLMDRGVSLVAPPDEQQRMLMQATAEDARRTSLVAVQAGSETEGEAQAPAVDEDVPEAAERA